MCVVLMLLLFVFFGGGGVVKFLRKQIFSDHHQRDPYYGNRSFI